MQSSSRNLLEVEYVARPAQGLINAVLDPYRFPYLLLYFRLFFLFFPKLLFASLAAI